jgi:methylthioribose-1-phosphate isomerase
MREIHAVAWDNDLLLLDQTLLPHEEKYLSITTVDQLVEAIEKLRVRGAPALGVAGAYGVVTALKQAEREKWSIDTLKAEIIRIRDARPTAVNLAWGVDQVMPTISYKDFDSVVASIKPALDKARIIHAEDVQSNINMAKNGTDYIQHLLKDRITQLAKENKKLRLLTHCNTGSLAATGVGTALGVIRELFNRGLVDEVFADETRPLLQGSRLTAWELEVSGIPYKILPDSAAALAITSGLIDCALVGADRVAANGDSANKVGTLSVALSCNYADIPFFIIAPESTVDRKTSTGKDIPIEMRKKEEITEVAGIFISPVNAQVYNPAFDVTPAELIEAVITDKKAYRVKHGENLNS